MPAKLKNTYIVTDTVCALKISRKGASVCAMFDSRFLEVVKKQQWGYSGEIIQSSRKVAFSAFIGSMLGCKTRKELNDDYTQDNYSRKLPKITAAVLRTHLLSYNTKFHKVDRTIASEVEVELSVLLTDSKIYKVKVRNCDSVFVPFRLGLTSKGDLVLLDEVDAHITTLQRYLIEKLNLPVFSHVSLVNIFDLVTDGINFRGRGNRCEIIDDGDDAHMYMKVYCAAKDIPSDQQGYDHVLIKFGADAFDELCKYSWHCYNGEIIAQYKLFDSEGVLRNTASKLSRTLAEVYNIDIGSYIIANKMTRTYKRLLAVGGDQLKRFVSTANTTPSATRKRSAFMIGTKARQYRKVRVITNTTLEGRPYLDMSASALNVL